MLTVTGLSSGYGKVQILNNVNLDITEGEIVSVIGRNGVGKSTFCKTVIGILPTMKGQIIFDGDKNISKMSAYKRARAGIAYVPQGHGIFPKLTVAENLTIGALEVLQVQRMGLAIGINIDHAACLSPGEEFDSRFQAA